MAFILSYAVFGAAGVQKPFPRVRICFMIFFFLVVPTVIPFLLFSGLGILLKEMLIIVMEMGH